MSLVIWFSVHAVGKVNAAWEVPGVHAPHDMAVVASPVRLAGKERPLALLVAETWEAGNSRLHKFILLPQGVLLWPARFGEATILGRKHQQGSKQLLSAFHALCVHLCPHSEHVYLVACTQGSAALSFSCCASRERLQGTQYHPGAAA